MSPGPTPARPSPPPVPGADLAWEAFRYAVDAMSSPEAEAFGRLLGEDQAAREALAAAVDQLGALAIVAREVAARGRAAGPAAPRRRGWRGPSIAAAVAASVALLVWGAGGERPFAPAGGSSVASAWSAVHHIGPTGDCPAPVDLEVAAATDGDGLDESGADVAELPANRPLPSWIMAAVAPETADEPMAEEGN